MTTATVDDLAGELRRRLDDLLVQLRAELRDLGAPDWWSALEPEKPDGPLKAATVGELLAAVEQGRAELVTATAENLSSCVRAFVPPGLADAVAARCVARWPWVLTPSGAALVRVLTTAALDSSATFPLAEVPSYGAVPPDVAFAPLDVARWADAILQPLNPDHGDALERFVTSRTVPLVDPERPDEPMRSLGVHDRLLPAPPVAWYDGDARRECSWPALVLLYVAAEAVRESQRKPMVRLPAGGKARDAVRLLAAGPPQAMADGYPRDGYPWRDGVVNPDEGYVELVWDGRPRPLQLRLNLDGAGTMPREVLRGILAELAADGVRDWLVLHRMAGAQGATGSFRWSWAEHRERTAYARRVQRKNVTDEELAAAVVSRLHRLTRAELRYFLDLENHARGWVRVGPFGLLDVPAGREEMTAAGRSLRLARMRINPALYEGAHREAKDPHFTLLPEAALELPGPSLRLLVELVYAWQDSRDPAGVVRKAGTLWEYAHIRQRQHTQRKRWQEATTTLDRELDKLGKTVGLDWTRDPGHGGPELRYTIRPPASWTDRTIYGAPPLYVSKAAVPQTGAELAAWRKARGLSLRALEALCGVGYRTLSRAEHTEAQPLAPELTDALARAVTER